MANPLAQETIFFDKWRCDDAERVYQERLAQGMVGGNAECSTSAVAATTASPSSLVSEIVKARQHIQKSLTNESSSPAQTDGAIGSRLERLEKDNRDLRKVTQDLQSIIKKLESRVCALEKGSPATATPQPQKEEKKEESKPAEEEDDDFELFGSDEEEEDEEAEKIKEERLKKYAEKKSKKPGLIAKSNVILDIKPWDDETDMAELEKVVRSIKMDGLLWGASKLVPLAYGIKKLQISTVIEDEKVSTEVLEEMICEFEDFIQSVDIAAFNKV